MATKNTSPLTRSSHLVKLLITEKSYRGQESLNEYTFVVTNSATKTTVKTDVQKIFNVKVAHVNMIRTPGKFVQTAKSRGVQSDTRKAIVRLQSGQTLDILTSQLG